MENQYNQVQTLTTDAATRNYYEHIRPLLVHRIRNTDEPRAQIGADIRAMVFEMGASETELLEVVLDVANTVKLLDLVQ